MIPATKHIYLAIAFVAFGYLESAFAQPENSDDIVADALSYIGNSGEFDVESQCDLSIWPCALRLNGITPWPLLDKPKDE